MKEKGSISETENQANSYGFKRHSISSFARQGRVHEVSDFLRSSPVWQLFATLNLYAAAVYGRVAVDRVSEAEYSSAVGLVAFALLNAICVGYDEMIAARRYSDYKRVKALLTKHGWDRRIIRPNTNAWCQRHAARMAAIDNGYGGEINRYYTEEGYKWYHLFPRIKK